MPPADALNVRTQVTEQLDNTLFRGVLDFYAEAQYEEDPKRWPLAKTQFNAASFDQALRMAETFYVSPDMQNLAMLAAEDFPTDEVILKEDQPAEVGFIYLPERFREIELRGRVMVVHAVLWTNERFWCLTDRLDPEDEISREIREDPEKMIQVSQVGRWDVNLTGGFHFGESIPQTVRFPSGVLPSSAKVNWVTRPDGTRAMMSDHAVGVAPILMPMPIMRLLLAIWRLMQQTLAEVEKVDDHPRPFKRRALKHQVPTRVTVIALRRRRSHATGTGTPLSYRTLTRGHWRKVWCGKQGEERYQRSVYIHEYIRGPENAPLIIRPKVNALVR